MENEGYDTIDLLEVLNAVRQHLLAVQGPLHVRVYLRLYQVPRIPEVRLRFIQAVNDIHEFPIFIHLCSV